MQSCQGPGVASVGMEGLSQQVDGCDGFLMCNFAKLEVSVIQSNSNLELL